MLSKSKPNSILTYSNGVLSLTEAGHYTYEILGSGKVKFQLDGGKSTFITLAEFNGLTTFNLAGGSTLDLAGSFLDREAITFTGSGNLNLTGVSIPEAVLGSPVEANFDFSKVSFGGTLETVNGSRADYIKVMWDLLDDAYGSGSYYNTPINEAFIRLGIEYLEYLQDGGAPLTDFTAKANAAATRDQSIHDNLLGNFNPVDFDSRFPDGSDVRVELLDQIEAAGFSDIFTRGVFSGSTSDVGKAGHDSVRAYDYDKGWSRSDWIDAYFGKVDPLASDDRNNDGIDEQMFYGTGNSNAAFSVIRHEGAGVELALKAKEFGPNGGDTLETPTFDANGTAHYEVSAGASPDNAARADWSFDYALTVLASGQDDTFTFKLFVDIDESAGEDLVEIPMTTFAGLQQGSSNYGFGTIRNLIDIDDATDGIQPYDFGAGQFTIELRAYEADGDLLATNKIVVHVGDVII